jgi:hypothetical protein
MALGAPALAGLAAAISIAMPHRGGIQHLQRHDPPVEREASKRRSPRERVGPLLLKGKHPAKAVMGDR